MDPLQEDVAALIDSWNDKHPTAIEAVEASPEGGSRGERWEVRLRAEADARGDAVFSFSHFLPRIDLNCEKRPPPLLRLYNGNAACSPLPLLYLALPGCCCFALQVSLSPEP